VSSKNPRQVAIHILQERRRGIEFVEDLMDSALSQAGLAPADRGLCQELVYGVARWQATLDWLVARKTDGRPQRPALQDLLRLGLYQIFWLDRIPPHAAVNETVELAKQSDFRSQSGFINAILRGYLREFDATKKILVDLKISKPHLGWSHPEWLVDRWQQRWGAEKTASLLEWNNTPPKTYARVNLLKANPEELLAQWRDENVEYDFVRRDWLPENLAFELKSHPPLHKLPSFQSGQFYIQDPSTLLAVQELEPKPGETILDLCAAPGGKTTYIAQLMRNEGKIIASDIFPDRLKLIEENCKRLGITCVEALLPSTLDSRPPTQYDRILIDAPCSNTGVMRRRVDLRWRIQPEEIQRLRDTQLELLHRAVKLLKPDGVLVYSTCSLEPEENSEVIKEFLIEQTGIKPERDKNLLPFIDGVDGAFVTRLRKTKVS
jgi:16S rRNA (cytosine967-C5)-methyltransferase